MLEDRNNTMIFLWEIYSIFMQISSIVLVLQHGRRAHTLLSGFHILDRAVYAAFVFAFFFVVVCLFVLNDVKLTNHYLCAGLY